MTNTEGADQEDDGKVNAMIGAGADIAGAAVGSALGFLAAGPGGAAAGGAGGAMAAHALRGLGEEAANRLLGPREKVRVGGALAIAASKIRSRIERGETLRQDGFFDPKGNGRSDADEVAESVLLKCQREAEEKKIPYMAFLIGNIAFDAQISPGLAHQIVRTAEALTYRQLCLLKIAALRENYQLRQDDYRGQQRFEKSLYELLYECLDLYHRALVNFGGEVAFGPTDIKPGSMAVQGMGADLFNQMGLTTIPQPDLDPIIAELSK
ncbi:hypothetical protein K1T73_06380 [Roseovarius sp. SCSIO 43702]|uniref:hypothetical protein n=1 Tax=Roseovarius sp. SCSIO 43702 TaxID=2823043 RepID=UPI001C73A370|nr:hypothetical protein [Roseovarius sp. SCSIO 43702]QYX58000.1 hypothetical protein K1T73_06380 [Roseovarius sp. SCSIO 43702]